jgi:hypothetical protein
MSSSSGRIAINDLTDPSPFLSNGAAGGLNISEISTAGATISFRYGTSGAISVPTLVSPTNASTGISLTPKLIWNSDIDAVSYQIQISLVADFSSTLLNQTGLTDTSYQVASALAPNTLHYWRVKKVTSGGSSNWSGAWNFTTSFAPPTLAEPVNNSTNIDPVSILRWNSVAGAFGYNLQVSTDSNFTNIVIDQANLSTLSYLTTGLLSNSKYYWHVSAIASGGTSSWSNFWCFSTSLEAPQLLSPTDGARGIPLNGKLIWKKVQIANAYKLQLSSDENFTTNIVNLPNWADTSSTYPALQYGKRYFWHTATIKSPDVSNWSLTNSFYTLLQAPILVYPANNATGVAN